MLGRHLDLPRSVANPALAVPPHLIPLGLRAQRIERTCRALVRLGFYERDAGNASLLGSPISASGILLSLGGREFVFTSRQCLENQTPSNISVQLYGERAVAGNTGDLIVSLFHAKGDVDAGVIELEPEAFDSWPAARPFEPHDLQSWVASQSDSNLCLCGFPFVETMSQPTLPGLQSNAPALVTQLVEETQHVIDNTRSLATLSASRSTRAISIHYMGSFFDPALRIWREGQARKMLGGVLVAITSSRATPVGIGHHFENEDGWCEPLIECARLLVDHDSEQVTAAAREVVRTLDC
jgi:hypothetical protein